MRRHCAQLHLDVWMNGEREHCVQRFPPGCIRLLRRRGHPEMIDNDTEAGKATSRDGRDFYMTNDVEENGNLYAHAQIEGVVQVAAIELFCLTADHAYRAHARP